MTDKLFIPQRQGSIKYYTLSKTVKLNRTSLKHSSWGVNGGQHSHWMLVWVKIHTGPKTSTRVTQTSSPTPTSTWCLLDLNQKKRTTAGAWRSITRLLWAGEARQSWSATCLGERNWCKTYDPSISLPLSQLAKSWQMNFGCNGLGQFVRPLRHLKTPQHSPKDLSTSTSAWTTTFLIFVCETKPSI